MPFYLFRGRYTAASLKALVETPQDREAGARSVVEAVGGKLHHLFFCFGQDDVVALIEAPDDQAMAACALAVGASGTMSGGATTRLLTSAEAKAAMKQAQGAAAAYKPVAA